MYPAQIVALLYILVPDTTALDLQLYVYGTMHGTVRTLLWEVLLQVHFYISSCEVQDTRPKYGTYEMKFPSS